MAKLFKSLNQDTFYTTASTVATEDLASLNQDAYNLNMELSAEEAKLVQYQDGLNDSIEEYEILANTTTTSTETLAVIMESTKRRLGISGGPSLSNESFDNLTVSLEGIVNTVVDGIKKIIAKIIAFIKSFWDKLLKFIGIREKQAVEIAGQIEENKKKIIGNVTGVSDSTVRSAMGGKTKEAIAKPTSIEEKIKVVEEVTKNSVSDTNKESKVSRLTGFITKVFGISSSQKSTIPDTYDVTSNPLLTRVAVYTGVFNLPFDGITSNSGVDKVRKILSDFLKIEVEMGKTINNSKLGSGNDILTDIKKYKDTTKRIREKNTSLPEKIKASNTLKITGPGANVDSKRCLSITKLDNSAITPDTKDGDVIGSIKYYDFSNDLKLMELQSANIVCDNINKIKEDYLKQKFEFNKDKVQSYYKKYNELINELDGYKTIIDKEYEGALKQIESIEKSFSNNKDIGDALSAVYKMQTVQLNGGSSNISLVMNVARVLADSVYSLVCIENEYVKELANS